MGGGRNGGAIPGGSSATPGGSSAIPGGSSAEGPLVRGRARNDSMA